MLILLSTFGLVCTNSLFSRYKTDKVFKSCSKVMAAWTCGECKSCKKKVLKIRDDQAMCAANGHIEDIMERHAVQYDEYIMPS